VACLVLRISEYFFGAKINKIASGDQPRQLETKVFGERHKFFLLPP
jgi:hypothetical protein